MYSAAHDPNLSRNLKWSAIIHLAILTFVIVKSLIFPSQTERYSPALRVDIVALPDILKKDDRPIRAEKTAPEPTPAKAQEKEATAEPDEMVLKPKKVAKDEKSREKKIESALARIKALNKISEEESEPQVYKGNIISKGSVRSGDAKESAEPSYYDGVLERLKIHWALPVWLSRQNLSAQVMIFIDGKGLVRSLKFVKSSGNDQFDQNVRQTIQNSQPFDPPPIDMRVDLLSNGILLGFPL